MQMNAINVANGEKSLSLAYHLHTSYNQNDKNIPHRFLFFFLSKIYTKDVTRIIIGKFVGDGALTNNRRVQLYIYSYIKEQSYKKWIEREREKERERIWANIEGR